MSQTQPKEIVLLRYSIILQPDGQLRSQLENLNPDEFIKAAKEVDDKWDGSGVIAQGLKYAIEQLRVFDIELDKHLLTL